MNRRMDAPAMALMVLLCATWGLGQVAMKIGNEGLSPLVHAGLRSVGSLALLAAWCAWRGVRLLPPRGTRWAAFGCGLLFSAEFVAVYIGLEFTTAARGVVFLYTAPCLVALLAHWLLPEDRLTRARGIGLGVCLAGLALAFADSLRLPSGRELLGDALCFVGALCWGGTTVLIKASRLRSAPAEATLAAQLGVSALLVPLGLLVGEAGVFDPNLRVMTALGFQVLLVAFASYLAWFWLVTRYQVSGLASFSFLTPVFGVAAGALILGDAVTPALGVALVLICAGIWLVNRPA